MCKSSSLLAATLCLTAFPHLAHAGRPMSTDDAGTVGDAHYQIEAWREHTDNQHSTTLAPAFGFGDFEFGLEVGKTVAPEALRIRDRALSLKWAPENLALGPLRFGAKAWIARSRETTEEENSTSRENGAIAISSWNISETIAAHLNLGFAHNGVERRNERIANVGVSWAIHERVSVFAEALHQQHSPTSQATGLRFWLIPEKLGLDLTASRETGVRNSRTIGIGFGWYGDFVGN